jgi:hypothetical protein
MSLADDIAALPKRMLGIDDVLDRLDDDKDRDALLGVLREPSYSDNTIATLITRNGYDLSAAAVGAWRRRNGVRG